MPEATKVKMDSKARGRLPMAARSPVIRKDVPGFGSERIKGDRINGLFHLRLANLYGKCR